MDGPKAKSDSDFAWNAIKKAINAKVVFELAVERERRIYELQRQLWEPFKKALEGGEILEIDPMYKAWIKDALKLTEKKQKELEK